MSDERPETCPKCGAPVVWCQCDEPPLMVISEITDDNLDDIAKFALSMYLGETCPYCLIEFQTMDQLKEAVWNGYSEYGRIAHASCFFEAHPEVKKK